MDAATRQALFAAIQDDDLEKVLTLLKDVAGPIRVENESGASAILTAVYYGRRAMAEALAEKWTPLDVFEAVAMGRASRVRELIDENPARARAHSPDGFPVLGLAAAFGHADVVELLLSKGADINASATNGTGYNALTGAVAQKHRDVAALLLARGANANHRYGPAWSPLHEAAMQGEAEMVTLLLEYGADPNAKTDEGKTPLQIALDTNRAQVAEILQSRDARERGIRGPSRTRSD